MIKEMVIGILLLTPACATTHVGSSKDGPELYKETKCHQTFSVIIAGGTEDYYPWVVSGWRPHCTELVYHGRHAVMMQCEAKCGMADRACNRHCMDPDKWSAAGYVIDPPKEKRAYTGPRE